MTSKIHNLLVPFYFGTVKESDRLFVEKELLTDAEALVDYLDLKRQMEEAEAVPSLSPKIWSRLQRRLQPRRQVIFGFSIGMAVLASLILISLYLKPAPTTAPQHQDLLFDSNSELSTNSGVL